MYNTKAIPKQKKKQIKLYKIKTKYKIYFIYKKAKLIKLKKFINKIINIKLKNNLIKKFITKINK